MQIHISIKKSKWAKIMNKQAKEKFRWKITMW